MNALAMEGALEKIGQPARVLSAVAMPSLCQPYSRQAALAHLVKRRVIILAAAPAIPSSPPIPARRCARPSSRAMR